MPFSIHQFSSGIINPTQNRKSEWVSGGFGVEIVNESFLPVPEEIRKAVQTKEYSGWRGFGIPDAYAPKLGEIALIARDLGKYCVLAVANIQKDEGDRPFIAYRYFWLDKTQFQNHSNKQDFDGIRTLLWYWQDKGQPQYNIEELQTNPNSYTKSWDNLLTPYPRYQPEELTEIYPRLKPLLDKIRQANQPLLYEADQINGELSPDEVHRLAIQYCTVNRGYINWAWNVRKLENPKNLNVIYCADAEAFNWFNSRFPSPIILSTPTPTPAPTSTSLSHKGLTTQNTPQNQTSNNLVTQCLHKFGLQFTENDVLNLLDFYQQYQEQIWDAGNQTYLKSFSTAMPNPSPPNIKYATLLTALAPNQTQDILSNLIKLNPQEKRIAIHFLDDLKTKANQNESRDHHPFYNYFYGAISSLRDKLLESLEQKGSNFSPSKIFKQITQSKPPFWAWIFFFLLLGGLIYGQKSNILSISLWGHKIDIPHTNSTENPATNPTQQTNNANPNLVFLLNMYEKTFDAVKIGKDPQIDLSSSESFQSISTAIQKSTEEILKILNENQQLLIDLKSQYPQVIQEARKPDKYPIYNDLKQFTTLNSAKIEDLPNLSLGNQENDALSVNMLQEALKRGDYYTAGKEYTPGIFDEATQNAVTSAQTQAKFSEDEITGFVGEKTWSNILKDRLQDLQLEAVYLTLKGYLKQSNPTYNIVTEIKKCRDKNKDQNALHFNKCLENIGKSTTPSNKGTESGENTQTTSN
jgi:hypothetical protein